MHRLPSLPRSAASLSLGLLVALAGCTAFRGRPGPDAAVVLDRPQEQAATGGGAQLSFDDREEKPPGQAPLPAGGDVCAVGDRDARDLADTDRYTARGAADACPRPALPAPATEGTAAAVAAGVPHELSKVDLPTYVIEPPDILTIDALRVVPRPPYHIEPLDALLIRVGGLPPEAPPIDNVYVVSPDGTVVLGAEFGAVGVDGLTLDQAAAAVEARLRERSLRAPRVVVALAQSQAAQQIRGEHLVRPDGTINLGVYGSVHLTGLTVEAARAAIEAHLAAYLVRPRVAVDVVAYNSKTIYVITDGAGYGQTVIRLPVTGNETVLDAISQVNGLAPQASKCHIWVARPNPTARCAQVLPVDWNAVVEGGVAGTNYQLLPGDRVFVQSDTLVTTANWINKIVAPVERVFGVTLLGADTVNILRHPTTGGTGAGGF